MPAPLREPGLLEGHVDAEYADAPQQTAEEGLGLRLAVADQLGGLCRLDLDLLLSFRVRPLLIARIGESFTQVSKNTVALDRLCLTYIQDGLPEIRGRQDYGERDALELYPRDR